MEAVKQGSAAVGLKVMSRTVGTQQMPPAVGYSWKTATFSLLQSKTHAILATLKRAPSDLSSFQRKIFKIDDHLGIAISGLTADGRILCRYMRGECLNHRQAVWEGACSATTSVPWS